MTFNQSSERNSMDFFPALNSQRGSALLVALLMLVVLTLIGIAATTTTTFELQIAGNDKLYKRAFYAADGATEMGGELIERNIEERNWDEVDSNGNLVAGGTSIDDANPYYIGNVRVVSPNPYMNREVVDDGIPSDTNRDAVYPRTATNSDPHTNVKIVGNTTLSTGSAIQLIAGYEGKGKGAAGGGAWITYDVRAQRIDVRDTAVTVRLGWRHVL
jgi:Tfp pilus assembly protein PilX